MKISYNWLKTYVGMSQSAEEVAELLTQSGLEVSHITPFRVLPRGLVVGKVLTCVPHPNAAHLKKTTVDIGQRLPLAVICGAANVAAGQKVIVAPAGTVLTLPDGKELTIKKRIIRDEVSEAMICAASELGFVQHPADHILVVEEQHVPGRPAEECLKVGDDTILEIDLTPNRSDACSHLGVAQEVAAINGKNVTLPPPEPLVPVDDLHVQLVVKEKKDCPAYAGIVLSRLVIKPSPIWLQNRLMSIGVNPVNNVIDSANFVMYDLGQPLHIYDYDKIEGKKLILQKLKPGTVFTDLHGKEHVLNGEELMVCDAAGPLCMAGVIGGLRARVTDTTRTVFLENGYFDPTVIRKSARAHHLYTDAAFRFERGTNPRMRRRPIKNAAHLIEKLANGAIASEPIDYHPEKRNPAVVTITYEYINRIIGEEIPKGHIHQILKNLDIIVKEATDAGFTAIIPLHRRDVTAPIDLVEEILRIHGYNALVTKKERITLPLNKRSDQGGKQKNLVIAQFLAAQGYHEIQTNAIVQAYTAGQRADLTAQVLLANPQNSQLNALRQTLLFSGLEVLRHNLCRQQSVLKFFECGKIYQHSGGGTFVEQEKWGIFLAGDKSLPHWSAPTRKANLQDLLATVYQLGAYLGIDDLQPEAVTQPQYSRGLVLQCNQSLLGCVGEVASHILEGLGIHTPVFFAELDLACLLAATQRDYQPISPFPGVARDLSLAIDESVTYADIRAVVQQQGLKECVAVHLIDVYTAPALGAGKKSYTIRLSLQDTKKTLNEARIQQIVAKLGKALRGEVKAEIRE